MNYMIKNKNGYYFALNENIEPIFTLKMFADVFTNRKFCEKTIKRFKLKEVEIVEKPLKNFE